MQPAAWGLKQQSRRCRVRSHSIPFGLGISRRSLTANRGENKTTKGSSRRMEGDNTRPSWLWKYVLSELSLGLGR